MSSMSSQFDNISDIVIRVKLLSLPICYNSLILMDKIIDYLKQLDLSDVEAKLYLKLLQSGPTSVRDLALTIDIKRTTAYFYIDQLVEKGLIMKIVKGSKKLVAANEPENLHFLVEKKLESAKAVQQNLSTILYELKAALPEQTEIDNAEIKYYKGAQGIKKFMKTHLRQQSSVLMLR